MDTTLVIMAAGMGSRFGGGIKQLEPLGPNGEVLMLYSIYDAIQAGFNKVVFITRKELLNKFEELVTSKIRSDIEIEYVFQEINDLPEGFDLPEGRVKPWGTGQAILTCKNSVKEPFLVINADDYYGKAAFDEIHRYLMAGKRSDIYDFCMAGFILGNTLSDNGTVTRGVCSLDADGDLSDVNETENIVKTVSGAGIEAEDGSIAPIDASKKVSMNMWGFTPEIFTELEEGFVRFLKDPAIDPDKIEYLLPVIVDDLIKGGKAKVKVLETNDKWFGVTYQADKECVKQALKDLVSKGEYPEKLF